jgi:uncharacterized protein
MQIQNDSQATPHSILAIDERSITIGEKTYTDSLIVSANTLIPCWPVSTIAKLKKSDLDPILALKPKVIILGAGSTHEMIPPELQHYLLEKGIGIECMTTAAACRTINILFNEGRDAVAGLMI